MAIYGFDRPALPAVGWESKRKKRQKKSPQCAYHVVRTDIYECVCVFVHRTLLSVFSISSTMIALKLPIVKRTRIRIRTTSEY